jgi:glutathione S-transferase
MRACPHRGSIVEANAIILHHFWLSPFSEKIRLLLGHCELDWLSVEQPPRLPRPDLTPLTGGYRKMPVMQIGADIYCDTHVMAPELMRLGERPELLPAARADEITELADWADSRLFMTVITASMGLSAVNSLRREHGYGWGELLRVVTDRVRMMRGADVPRIPPKQARAELKDFLERMSQQMEGAYRFGEVPTLADFSLCHVLGFGHETLRAGFLDAYPSLLEWYARMRAIGHGRYRNISRAEALAVAAENEPAELPVSGGGLAQGLSIGDAVRIAPADYGTTSTEGELVAATAERWIIARDAGELGRLHVHFPRQGFHLAAR